MTDHDTGGTLDGWDDELNDWTEAVTSTSPPTPTGTARYAVTPPSPKPGSSSPRSRPASGTTWWPAMNDLTRDEILLMLADAQATAEQCRLALQASSRDNDRLRGANAALKDERARIVAWLRTEAEEFEQLRPRGIEAAVYAYIAGAIERGEAAE